MDNVLYCPLGKQRLLVRQSSWKSRSYVYELRGLWETCNHMDSLLHQSHMWEHILVDMIGYLRWRLQLVQVLLFAEPPPKAPIARRIRSLIGTVDCPLVYPTLGELSSSPQRETFEGLDSKRSDPTLLQLRKFVYWRARRGHRIAEANVYD